jgi:hypothetical protein
VPIVALLAQAFAANRHHNRQPLDKPAGGIRLHLQIYLPSLEPLASVVQTVPQPLQHHACHTLLELFPALINVTLLLIVAREIVFSDNLGLAQPLLV